MSTLRAIVLDEKGAPTRGIVDVTVNDVDPAQEGKPLRFACFDSLDDGGSAPRFDDCVEMVASRDNDPGCDTARENSVDAWSYGGKVLDMFPAEY